MALIVPNLVGERVATTGTGSFLPIGPFDGLRSFASVANDGDTFYYACRLESLSEWEIGLGTWDATNQVVERTTIIESSNSGSAVNFSAGYKSLYICIPNQRLGYEDENGDLIITGTFVPDAITVGNGTVSAPSIAFTSDVDTGFYRIGANNLGIAANGAKVVDVATTGVGVTGALSVSTVATVGDGSVSAPAISFSADTNSGLYRIGADNIGITANGAKVVDIATTGLSVTGAISASTIASVGNGSVSAPSLSFSSDANTGIYRIGADNIGIAANGAKVVDVSTSGISVTGNVSGDTIGTSGTWTPVLTAAVSPTGLVYSYASGTYIKIGKLVYVSGGLILASKGTGGSGTVRIAGLPFTSRAYGPYQNPVCSGFYAGFSTSTTAARLCFLVNNVDTTMDSRIMDNADTPVPWSEITDGTVILVTAIYESA